MKMVGLFLLGASLGFTTMTCYDLYKENKYLNEKLDKITKKNKKEVK